MKVFYTFNKKDKDAKQADLYIYDIIGDPWGDGVTAKQFAKDLLEVGSVGVLNIFINSPGGSVWDGIAMYNQLVRHKAEKKVFVDGLAGSIATVVAMAGDEITTAKNGTWMIHNPYAFVIGGAEDLRREAERLDALGVTIRTAYVDRAGGKSTEKQFNEWMDAETWFNAEEALAAGLTDKVSEKEIAIAAMAKHDLSQFRFKHVPETLLQLQNKAQGEGSTAPAERRQRVDLARCNSRVLTIQSNRTRKTA